jgi:ubiquinone/menaquinone biosynthesis C-methylase UbiE
MDAQVSKYHYQFGTYMDKRRWASVWHQLDEVQRFKPESVLEIGVGAGLFKTAAEVFGFNVKTLDIVPDLKPDYLGSADAIPLPDKSVDVVCAFQVLEHMPFEVSLKALAEMRRVTRKAIVVSLPDAKVVWVSTVKVPLLKTRRWMIPNPLARPQEHVFDGEHYWEINKRGYSLGRVLGLMREVVPAAYVYTYRVHENPYHRFVVFGL